MIDKTELIQMIENENFDAVVFLGVSTEEDNSTLRKNSTYVNGPAPLTFEIAQYLAAEVKQGYIEQIQKSELPDYVKKILINSAKALNTDNPDDIDDGLTEGLNGALGARLTDMISKMNEGEE